MASIGTEPGGVPAPTGLQQQAIVLQRRAQKLLDDTTPYYIHRWVFSGVAFLIFMARVLTVHKWYIVTYALGIYLLNLFLAFLQPKFDPALEALEGEEEDKEGPGLPTRMDDEFRPFIRRLPEFKFWFAATRAILISLFCTLFEIFDVPVFWPILLVYFLVLLSITMKRQIRHMIKYKYVPWNFGKKVRVSRN
ncbi:hypothetical protein HDV00_000154 [Rhizophlyctis rosea]|nr:hypothetical protein HDV00_000154 [Rhizophlyctis rosea]